MAKEKGVSLRPKDQIKGGGLWPSVPSQATIKEPHFEKIDMTTKDGKVVAKGVPVLMLTFQPADGSEKRVETFSAGAGWKVTEERLIPQNGQTGLNDNCNAALFFNSLEDAGYDMSQIDDDVTALDGLEVVVHRAPRPKVNESDKDKTIILIKSLVEEEKPAAKKKGKATDEDEDEAPKKKRAAKDDDDEDEKPKAKAKGKGKGSDVEDTAKEALIEAVEEAGGKLKLRDVGDAVAKIVKGHPDAKAIVDLVEDEDFLQKEDGWSFDGKTVEAE